MAGGVAAGAGINVSGQFQRIQTRGVFFFTESGIYLSFLGTFARYFGFSVRPV